MWWTNYWQMPWMMFGPIVMVVFMILCMTMMWSMMRGGHRSRSGYALDILNERYARGEINLAEYEERRRTLDP